MLGQIAPVRSDVAKRRRGAALIGLEPPGIVGILEEPVLQIVAVQKVRRTDVASSNGHASLLDERIPAVVERDRMDDAGAFRFVEKRSCLGAGHRQRLVGHDVLAPGDRGTGHRVVQVVRRRDVHDVDTGVVEQRLEATVASRNTERLRLVASRGVARGGKRHDVDEAQPPYGVDVVRADEAGADKTHPDAFDADH